MTLIGPGQAFELILEVDPLGKESSVESSSIWQHLNSEFSAIYQGSWAIAKGEPYLYSNFVISHDGRASFNVAGHEGGGDISGFNKHDKWLMGLLRARADAVIVGANTLRSEPEHEWSAQFIYPQDSLGFENLRQLESRLAYPLQVFVTQSGEVQEDAPIFAKEHLECVIVTSKEGAFRIKQSWSRLPKRVSILESGDNKVDLRLSYKLLREKYGINSILCEGGPRLYGSAIASNLIDEEFLTISPVLVGNTDQGLRPGLIEGTAFAPGGNLRAKLSSVRRAGDHLFLRTRYRNL